MVLYIFNRKHVRYTSKVLEFLLGFANGKIYELNIRDKIVHGVT